jgi:pyrimidine-nucleoside phosphorylase
VTDSDFAPRSVIAKKRDRLAVSSEEISRFISSFVAGSVTDYQMTAFLMAAFLNGLTGEETAALTLAMAQSGRRLKLDRLPGIKVDKHSTGGVGDKVSIPLAPLVAACGVPVPMVSGRGLGHTGGTLDKLESIPGFRTRLSAEDFERVLAGVGYVMGGQSEDLAPADRRMYALRDVTATIESIPLIVSSILSKKIAEGAQALVLDVKCGRGAFMADEQRARTLARELVRVGTLLGLKTVAFITDMDRPLGRAVGHSVEIEESIGLLKGQGPPDLLEITLALGSAMLVLGEGANDLESARSRLLAAIADGSGLERFRKLVEAQGGDPGVLDDPAGLPQAPYKLIVECERNGYVGDLDPLLLAEAVVELGGGRRRVEDAIDPAVGILIHRALGEAVKKGEPLLTILAAWDEAARRVAGNQVRAAVRVDREPPPLTPLIRGVVTPASDLTWDEARAAKLQGGLA